jgi:hypothetical protein
MSQTEKSGMARARPMRIASPSLAPGERSTDKRLIIGSFERLIDWWNLAEAPVSGMSKV